ncbi:MAG: type IV pilus modification protein PilV [Gammaproteobacteria bacterium]
MALPLSLPRSAHGFTLFEVLIAVLVLSLGLLGLAALQSAGLRSNHSAYHRSQATQFAYDIIDRMRGNKAIAEAAGYDLAMTAPPPSSPPDCITNPCSAAQLATYELNNWIQSLNVVLPSGDGAVACGPAGGPPVPCAAGLVVTVTVAWDDNRNGLNTDPNENFAMSTQL